MIFPSLAPRLVPRQLESGCTAVPTAVHPPRKEVKRMRIRALFVMAVSVAVVVLGSGIAQALPRLHPIW